MGSVRRVGLAFVMEQTLGHTTHYQNLRHIVEADPAVQATWYPLSFEPQTRTETLPLLRSNWSARASWRAWRALVRDHATTRYDAVFFHTQVTTLLCPSMMRRVPSVISLDATPANYDSIGAGYGHRRAGAIGEGLKHGLHSRPLRAARALIAFSEWARRSLIDDYNVPAERIHVIAPGVDLIRWSVPAHRSDWNSDARIAPFRLLFVGGDFARKGGQLLLDVFRQSLRDTCELHLVTNGAIKEEPGVRVYRHLGSNDPALLRLYERCHALVLPTQADCFSHVSIEAMATGLPVISCPTGGIPEIVRDRKTGFLIPPGDARALLEAIRALESDSGRAASMGLAGRKLVEQRFDALTNAQRILAIMIGQSRSSHIALPHGTGLAEPHSSVE